MKRIIYLCASLSMLIAVIDLILLHDGILFINQILPALTIYFVMSYCKKDYHFKYMTFFSVWITIYNISYVILRIYINMDLYNVPYRIPIQLGVPFLVSVLFRIAVSHEEDNN